MFYSGSDWIMDNEIIAEDQLKCSTCRPSPVPCEGIADLSFSVVSPTIHFFAPVSLLSLNNCLLLPIATTFSIALAFDIHHCSRSLRRHFSVYVQAVFAPPPPLPPHSETAEMSSSA
ncbi:unnamed protein product [Heterobilharzia americana]|nr:unnamed protein product [Heterobilharzia americana]